MTKDLLQHKVQPRTQ